MVKERAEVPSAVSMRVDWVGRNTVASCEQYEPAHELTPPARRLRPTASLRETSSVDRWSWVELETGGRQ